MRTTSELRGAINDLRDELDSYVAVAAREERDLNDEEHSRVNEITNTLIPGLQKQCQTVMAIEKEKMERANNRINELLKEREQESGRIDASAGGNISRFTGVKIPAKAQMHGPLTAFKGETAERDAFVAGNVICAALFNNSGAMRFCQNYGLQVNATLTTGTNSTGGFLVPEEMLRAIVRLREERGVFPRYANRVPMGSDIIRIPRLLSDVTAYWTGEGSEITASDPTLGEAELMARKIGALCKISSELDEEAVVEIGDIVTTSMAYAMADKVDDAAFNGDGTSTYGGVVGLKNALNASAIHDALAGNIGASTLDLDDFEAVVGKYPQYTGADPRWFMHSAVYYAGPMRLMNAAGGNTNATIANGVQVPMFLGYPVQFTQVMPSTTGSANSTILAYFGDLKLGAAYGTRRSTRTEVSTERYFELDLIGIKTTERIAINIHERGDTIRNRPIIALKTAS